MFQLRFGVCEPYIGDVEVCEGVLSADIDYVFIPKIHGSQKNISNFLKQNILTSLISSSDDDVCRNKLYQIICKYYLSPCGTTSSQLPPHSVCPEDCSTVQMECPSAWEAAQLGLKDYDFINCDDTTAFIFPLPSCCTSLKSSTPKRKFAIIIYH